jgi:hypothetical protein
MSSTPTHGPTPATEAQLSVLVDKIEDFIAGFLEIGDKMGIEPDPEAILTVVDRAIAHADEQPWAGQSVANEVERQFLQSLFEELNLEKEGLYDHWFDDQGRERFSPLAHDEWRAVLRLLRTRLAKALDL